MDFLSLTIKSCFNKNDPLVRNQYEKLSHKYRNITWFVELDEENATKVSKYRKPMFIGKYWVIPIMSDFKLPLGEILLLVQPYQTNKSIGYNLRYSPEEINIYKIVRITNRIQELKNELTYLQQELQKCI